MCSIISNFLLQPVSVQFSCSVMSNSLRSHGLQQARRPCPSPTPRACSNSCPLNQWCHPIISSSVILFSSCLQSFPESGSFPMSQFFKLGGQSIGASASASVLLVNIQDWFPLGWTGLISLQSKGLSKVFSNTAVQKHQFFGTQLSLWSKSYIDTWLLGNLFNHQQFLFFLYQLFLYFISKNYLSIYLFLAALGLCALWGLSLVASSRGYSLAAVHRVHIEVASLVAEHGL